MSESVGNRLSQPEASLGSVQSCLELGRSVLALDTDLMNRRIDRGIRYRRKSGPIDKQPRRPSRT
jgi:hypothetical protein